jgi:predicted dinucleotide-binding enzyme
MKRVRIGIIESGAVGKAVGQLWIEAGHTVYLGSRKPERIASEVASFGEQAHAVTLEDAASQGDVIFVALPTVCSKKHMHIYKSSWQARWS